MAQCAVISDLRHLFMVRIAHRLVALPFVMLTFLAVTTAAQSVAVDPLSLGTRGTLFADRAPLIATLPSASLTTSSVTPNEGTVGQATQGASLFTGQAGTSFFAPWPDRPGNARRLLGGGTGSAARLRDLIASVEASAAGYDSIQHGTRIQPAKLPTQMTIAEIYTWIKDTPGQPHAIGRYQIIPATLRRLVRKAEVSPFALYSPKVQDKLADILLEEAGYGALRSGDLSRTGFMNNLAKIWAGLPNSSGKSHYHGYAGNKAVISWTRFEQEMDSIFPRAARSAGLTPRPETLP